MLREAIGQGTFDVVAITGTARVGKSMTEFLRFLSELHGRGVRLVSLSPSIDTADPQGRALAELAPLVAQIDRGINTDRVKSGIARKIVNAKRRPWGGRRVKPDVEAAIRGFRTKGWGIHKIRRHVGVGASVVQRVLREGDPLRRAASPPA
jgi:DNA invertase Pin-like site-specific DNA recombinase